MLGYERVSRYLLSSSSSTGQAETKTYKQVILEGGGVRSAVNREGKGQKSIRGHRCRAEAPVEPGFDHVSAFADVDSAG